MWSRIRGVVVVAVISLAIFGSAQAARAAIETRQTLKNIGKILDAAGASFADVASVTVYLTDINDRAKINPVRQEFFGSARRVM